MKTHGHVGQFSFPKWNIVRSQVLFQIYRQVLWDKQQQKQHWELKAIGDHLFLCQFWIVPSMVITAGSILSSFKQGGVY